MEGNARAWIGGKLNRFETANAFAGPATRAKLLVDERQLSGYKLMLLFPSRGEKQFQVGRVDIGVGNDQRSLLRGQMGKGRRDGCFARASFSAENDKLFHLFTTLFSYFNNTIEE
jgi:hypothetical protein